VGYERLSAATEVEEAGFDYDLAANAFVARVAYRVPIATRFEVGLGVGGGIAIASGDFGGSAHPEFLRTKNGGPATDGVILGSRVEISGNGPYLEGFLQGEARLARNFAIVPSIGYRRARIEGTQRGSEGEADGTFDFSGLTARLALKIALD
jgi:hypothetical protein